MISLTTKEPKPLLTALKSRKALIQLFTLFHAEINMSPAQRVFLITWIFKNATL